MTAGISSAAADRTVPPVRAPDRHGQAPRWRILSGWALLAVLAVQAALSLRLIRADTASLSEALSLRAGHLEWAHWLHGTAIPRYPYFFSGAPVIYPPIGAAADRIGGLAGARILALVFMLGATTLLWHATGRLFGRPAAFFAAALFALLGSTLHLGMFATGDGMSVFLIALAAWCVLRAGGRGGASGWMAAAGAALALADATAYSSVLFDPVVLALAVLTVERGSGAFRTARRGVTVLIVAAALLTAGLLAGGGSYWSGFKRTTLVAAPGSATPMTVLANSWYWAGILVVLAVSGVVISAVTRQPAARTWLLAVLAAAGVLGPLAQARLHTAVSLNRHVGLGAWFAAMAAGYAAGRLIAATAAGRTRALTSGICVTALAFPAVLGASQSRIFSTSWPNAGPFIAIFGPLANHSTGRLLVEDPSVAEYYLQAGSQWQRWSSTRNIVLPSGASTGDPGASASVTSPGNASVYAKYIAAGYFSLVALNFADTTVLDGDLAADLRSNPHYHIILVIPYGTEVPPVGLGAYVIWRYEPGTRQQGYTPGV